MSRIMLGKRRLRTRYFVALLLVLAGITLFWFVRSRDSALTFKLRNFVDTVSFSPDGQRLAVTSNSCTIDVFDVNTGEQAAKFQLCEIPDQDEHKISYGEYSPDGTQILANLGSSALILNATTSVVEFSIDVDSLSSLAWSPDGTRIAVGNTKGTISLWDIQTGKEVLNIRGHDSRIFDMAFSPDGERLITIGFIDTVAKLWRVSTGELLHIFSGYGEFMTASFSPDGNRILTSAIRGAQEWDVHTGKEIRRFDVASWVISSAYSKNGRYLLLGLYQSDKILVIDAEDGHVLREFYHSHSSRAELHLAVFGPNNQTVATVAGDEVKIWRIN